MSLIIELGTWLLLASPMVAEIITDYQDYKKGKLDKKTQDVIIRGVLLTIVSIALDPVVKQSFWQLFLLGTGIFVMLFDPIMGYLIKKDISYLGTTSNTDKWWGQTPFFARLIITGILFAASILTYYDLDSIISR